MTVSSDPPRAGAALTFHEVGSEWISVHVFLRGSVHGPECDHLIAQCIGPFARTSLAAGNIRAFFLVRYGELGPHVRLRLYGARAILEKIVVPELEAYLANALPEALRSGPTAEPSRVSRTSRIPSLRWIPYEPELVRYGGPDGIRVAEQLFWCSSELTLDLLQSLPVENRQSRLGLTLATMVTFLEIFAETSEAAHAVARLHRDTYAGDHRFSGAGDWRQSFGRGYQKQAGFLRERVPALWYAAQNPETLPEPFRRYVTAGCRARAQIEELVATQRLSFNGKPCLSGEFARRALVNSYIHMTSNRLGITPMEEGYLMHLIINAMGPGLNAHCVSDTLIG